MILGVMLVRNEDLWIASAIQAIREFCDQIMVIDNGSTDDTRERAVGTGCVNQLIIEPDLRRTHNFIEHYAGTDTWVFGVDGDEIYDAGGLAAVREGLESGLCRDSFQVLGRYLHVTELVQDYARGYLGPPSHTPTKLYNFRHLRSWPADGQHSLFQCKSRVVRARVERDSCHQAIPWATCPLRCLHMRFVRRSSRETDSGARLSGEDRLGFGSRLDRGGSDDRNERLSYRRGDIVEVPSWV